MFENLTNKFEEVFSSLKKAPSLDESQVDEGLRAIRQALLEADVSLEVAKDFIEKVKPKALGQEIETNIFLRCNDPEIKHAIGLKDSSELEVFSKLRDLKDTF